MSTNFFKTRDVMDVRAEERNTHHRRRCHCGFEARNVFVFASGDESEVSQVAEEAAKFPAFELSRSLGRGIDHYIAEPRVHPIDDEGPDIYVSFSEPFGEVCRLLNGVAPR